MIKSHFVILSSYKNEYANYTLKIFEKLSNYSLCVFKLMPLILNHIDVAFDSDLLDSTISAYHSMLLFIINVFFSNI